jgi:acetyl esterase
VVALDPQAALVMDVMVAAFPDMGGIITDAVEARAFLARTEIPPGREVAQVEDRVVSGVPVRIYRPSAPGPLPVVVYYHGGGFTICNLETHDGVCRMLANDSDAIVISVDYRLAPEHKYPAAVEDAYAALLWTAENAASLGGDATRLAVAGDSAGGNLSAVVAQRARDEAGPELIFQLLIYPATDFAGDYPSRYENATGYFLTKVHVEWFAEQYLPSAEVAGDPQVSPLRAGTLAGLPPALVITAEYDPLRDEGEAYGAGLAEAGVPVTVHRADGLFHGFFGMGPFIPIGRSVEEMAAAALREAFAR